MEKEEKVEVYFTWEVFGKGLGRHVALARLFEVAGGEDIYFALKHAAPSATYIELYWDMEFNEYRVRRTISTDDELEAAVASAALKLTQSKEFNSVDEEASERLLKKLVEEECKAWSKVIVWVYNEPDDMYVVALAWR